MRGTLSAVAAAALLAVAPAAAGAACPAPCPYTGVASIGDRDGGQLRLPQAVAVDAGGRVYVGDQYTGAVQRFGPDGALQTAFGAPGTGNGEFGAVVGLAIDPSDGSVYVADAENDRVQHFTGDGTFIASFGGQGSAPGKFQFGSGNHVADPAQGGLAIGRGRLWVADAQNDRVQSFPLGDLRGSNPSTANAVVIGAGILNNPQGLWASDFLYVADDLNNVIRMFAPDDGALVKTIGLGGPGAAPGQFNGAWDVAVDANDRIYAVDDNNHRIQVFDPNGGPTGAVVGGWGGFGRGPGQLEYPRAITLGPDGQIYVANTADGRVDKFAPGGAYEQSFGQDGRLPGQFIGPGYLAASPDGGFGVPDVEGNRLEQFAPDNSLLTTYGGIGSSPDRVLRPQGMAFDAGFDAWIADTDNNRVVHRGFYGSVVAVLGTPGTGPGQFNAPLGIALDGTGGVLVADSRNDRVQRIAAADGTPLASYGPTIGSDTIDSPRGVAISPVNGRIYIASGLTNRVVVVDPATGARVTSFGGSGTTPGKFNVPGGVAIDAAGRVYVVDIGNDRVQRFSANGTFETSWGTEGTGMGEFEHPVGVAADCTGTIAVSDQDNNRVQRFTITDPRTSTCLATPAKPAVVPPPPPETPAGAPESETPTAPAATPPTPVVPKLKLRVTTNRMTGALTRRELRLTAVCDHACTLRLDATIAPRDSARRPKRRLRRVTRSLRAGQATTIVVRLTRTDVTVLRRALGRRTVLRLVITAKATATDAHAVTVARPLTARA